MEIHVHIEAQAYIQANTLWYFQHVTREWAWGLGYRIVMCTCSWDTLQKFSFLKYTIFILLCLYTGRAME